MLFWWNHTLTKDMKRAINCTSLEYEQSVILVFIIPTILHVWYKFLCQQNSLGFLNLKAHAVFCFVFLFAPSISKTKGGIGCADGKYFLWWTYKLDIPEGGCEEVPGVQINPSLISCTVPFYLCGPCWKTNPLKMYFPYGSHMGMSPLTSKGCSEN